MGQSDEPCATHSAGRDASQRIIALTDSNAGAQVLSLGVPLVGIATRDEAITPGIANVYDTENVMGVGNYGSPNIEAIARLQPDLIVAAAWQEQPEFDADVILYAPHGYEPRDHALFNNLRGVKAGQAYKFLDEYWNGTYRDMHLVLDALERILVEKEVDADVVA